MSMKTELVFKLEREPIGYGQVFAQNCEVKIKRAEGFMYLDYEQRQERIMGNFSNLRKEGELILADISLFERNKVIEHRLEYAIQGKILGRNEQNEVTVILITGVGALMPSIP